jgi:hypothetical protein
MERCSSYSLLVASPMTALKSVWRGISSRVGVKPRVDPGRVGLTFVDVLFAFVIGLALTPLGTWWKISLAGRMHLGVAVTLTLFSWIGYHNSVNRPQWVIGFINLPFFCFMLDISMVITYAFAVFTAETVTPGASPIPSLLPEAWVVVVSFVLYALWDLANLRLKLHAPYKEAWKRAQDRGDLKETETFPTDIRRRRTVTLVGLGVSLVSLATAAQVEVAHTTPSRPWIVGFDAWLVLLLLLYRVAKDWPYRAPPVTTGPVAG